MEELQSQLFYKQTFGFVYLCNRSKLRMDFFPEVSKIEKRGNKCWKWGDKSNPFISSFACFQKLEISFSTGWIWILISLFSWKSLNCNGPLYTVKITRFRRENSNYIWLYLHIGIALTQVKNPKSKMVKIDLIIDVACQNNLVRLTVTFGSWQPFELLSDNRLHNINNGNFASDAWRQWRSFSADLGWMDSQFMN